MNLQVGTVSRRSSTMLTRALAAACVVALAQGMATPDLAPPTSMSLLQSEFHAELGAETGLQVDTFDKMRSLKEKHTLSHRDETFSAEQLMSNEDYRLPRTIFPIHYDLSFKHLAENTLDFLGQSQIKAEIRVDSLTEIVLHGRGLSMTHLAIEPHVDDLQTSHLVTNNCCASFTWGTNRCVIDEGFDVGENNEAEFLLIRLPKQCALPKGRVDIIMRWTGKMHTELNPIGWHKQSMRTENIPRTVSSTAFQPMDARQVFPCFDEPNMKATFTLTIDTPRLPNINTGQFVPLPNIILSNMPAATEQTYLDGWRVRATFQTTPKMSTYQLNWVIGPFKAIQLKQRGPPIRVWASIEDVPFAQFALNAAGQLLPAMGTYFEKEYNTMMPKLDLVALPFLLSLAEQNWGLLSFRASSLMVKPSSTATQRQNVVQIVSHELCHQWFGNLVTVDWWDSIWVQEGAASWCARILTQKIYPEYGAWSGSFRIWTLRQDAVESSIPLIQQVNTPSDIAMMFQKGLVYHKGNFVYTMIRHVVGDKAFHEGLVDMLKANAFGCINTGSFINAMTRVAQPNMRINQIVSDYTFKRG
jgi:aminopeptidase N